MIPQANFSKNKTAIGSICSFPLSRPYKADRNFQLQLTLFTDTVDARVRSKDGNHHAQIFANEAYFATIFPMETKALCTSCREFGAPTKLIVDRSTEQTGKNTKFMQQVRAYAGIELKITEPGIHNQSPAEGVVREG